LSERRLNVDVQIKSGDTHETGSSMPRENVNDLLAFIAVVRERSFTRDAAQMGVSQSA
jgi:hypothetical protein